MLSVDELSKIIEGLRKKLLSTSLRGGLLNTPIESDRGKIIVIRDEDANKVFDKLYYQNKKMIFRAREERLNPNIQNNAPKLEAVATPHNNVSSEGSFASYSTTRYSDADVNVGTDATAGSGDDIKLQTQLKPVQLEKRLKNLRRTAETIEEEQGVRTLYLGIGFLSWYDKSPSQPSPQPSQHLPSELPHKPSLQASSQLSCQPASEKKRFAPLILLPVELRRDRRHSQFKLELRDDPLQLNLSLQAKLKNDFGLTLPNFPEADDWKASDYFEKLRKIIEASAVATSDAPWKVESDLMALGFYTFTKFLIYNDLKLDDGELEKIINSKGSVIKKILSTPSDSAASADPLNSNENLDTTLSRPQALGHILDADSSQTQVIAAVQKGTSMVVQGPPGTGKSQTIVNIIAAAVKEGKKILFVAAKRAALDVVYKRLEECGLGHLCLNLHSEKSNRKQVYEALKTNLERDKPEFDEKKYNAVCEMAIHARDQLNKVSNLLHDNSLGASPYHIMGLLARFDNKSQDELPRPRFSIEGSDTWSQQVYDKKKEHLERLVRCTEQYGAENQHLWRGAQKNLDASNKRSFKEEIKSAHTRLEKLHSQIVQAVEATRLNGVSTFKNVQGVIKKINDLEGYDGLEPSQKHQIQELLGFKELILNTSKNLILLNKIKNLQNIKSSLRDKFTPKALDTSTLEMPWNKVRADIKAQEQSWCPWLNKEYRNAIRQLKSVKILKLPPKHDRIQLLDALIEGCALKKQIAEQSSLGAKAFQKHWQGEDTDTRILMHAIQWIDKQAQQLGSGQAVKQQYKNLKTPEGGWPQMRDQLKSEYESWKDDWTKAAKIIQLDLHKAFGASNLEDVSIKNLSQRLEEWNTDLEVDSKIYEQNTKSEGGSKIYDWLQLYNEAKQVSECGLDTMRTKMATGDLQPQHACDTLTWIWANAVWKKMQVEQPDLKKINIFDRSELLEKFKKNDRQLLKYGAQHLNFQHHDFLPSNNDMGRSTIVQEANKKRKHTHLRAMLRWYASTISQTHPVFLMSPLSVAQYLTKEALKFDLLLIDEASQVRPEEALGAALRSQQIVVVGDQKQLPPTSFFDKIMSNEDDDEDDDDSEFNAATMQKRIEHQQINEQESILALCEGKLPGGMLRWHYRSQHPSLIAVSSKEFYDDKLIYPPNPQSKPSNVTGLSFKPIKDGQYTRGSKRDNPREAEEVVKEVLKHAREHPDDTLGVVTLSKPQCDLISDMISDMIDNERKKHPKLDNFFSDTKNEAFFVKNIENVQGDERDAIFISICYGRDFDGKMYQNFGPISQQGGERRLNVLFTRAKKRCRVFSSIKHTDINQAEYTGQSNSGRMILRKFLKYAETGEMDIPDPTNGEAESPFEEDVLYFLQQKGYIVKAQVGSKGFRIDLAVCCPNNKNQFLLAIECDGARYHSSHWARDRDRLRQEILEQHGWKFHRIWSTDWFENRQKEEVRLLEAIRKAQPLDV